MVAAAAYRGGQQRLQYCPTAGRRNHVKLVTDKASDAILLPATQDAVQQAKGLFDGAHKQLPASPRNNRIGMSVAASVHFHPKPEILPRRRRADQSAGGKVGPMSAGQDAEERSGHLDTIALLCSTHHSQR